ncbi:Riboflavin kinase [Pirellulimonas nuda]|uniref:Riboflavin biosynthesis protein n=1 Tax=Pirellulimonas nuda TaxID=2528009 RepID=A0A518D7M6_9BACT|nr:bifunctional riboflavin kinase/FAD synthetase [Pirellulimonas nuda]QDU87455.1 Riboflavin kinase [Pirellulimonas nuda]
MHVIRHLEDRPEAALGGAVAIGNFDGVHRGHAALIRKLVERARAARGPAVVFTFDPHPVRLLRPAECPPPLTWTERKAQLLAALGVDWVIAYPTDKALLALSARDFFQRIVVDALGARAMVEGPNFYFGHNREGTIDVLRGLTAEAGLSLDIVPPIEVEGELVSSSRVRRLVAEGAVGPAARLLTAPYRVRGLVSHGAGRGAQIGFPTANLAGIDTLLPAHGVYAGVGRLGDQRWPAAVNVGPNPTFGEHETKVEAHLVGCDEALYGQTLEVDLLEHLREIRPFASAELLAQQLKSDIASALDVYRRFLESRASNLEAEGFSQSRGGAEKDETK